MMDVIQKLPSNRALSMEQLSLLNAAANNPDYASQTDTVIGVLKEIYQNMVGDLEEIHTLEAAANRRYESLIAAKEEEIATFTHAQLNKRVLQSEVNQKLADATSAYDA